MKVIVVGAGRLGTQFAHVLAAAGNDVTLVDRDEDRTWTGPACDPRSGP